MVSGWVTVGSRLEDGAAIRSVNPKKGYPAPARAATDPTLQEVA